MSTIAALTLLLSVVAGPAVARDAAGNGVGHASADGLQQFVLMFLQNIVDMPQNRPVELHVINSGSDEAHVNVTLPLYTSSSCRSKYGEVVPARGTIRIVLCPDIRHSHFDGSVSNKAVIVTSDRNVSLIGYNSEMYSADAFSVLPLQSLRQIYLTTAYSPTNIATQFGIVATEENTTAGIYVKPASSSGDRETFFDYNGVVYKNGDSVRFALPYLHTFLAYSISDLSGVVVWADKPVAVFSGNARTYVDYARGSRDHIVEQAVPASQFGKSFAFLPTPRAHANDVVRIVARLRNTSVDVYSGSSRSTLSLTNAGDVFEHSYADVTHFIANKQVSISVVVRSQETPDAAATDPNDPSLYFLPPTELYSAETRLTPTFVYSVDNGPFSRSFVLISIAEGQQNGTLVDGLPVTEWSKPVTGWSKPALSPLRIVSTSVPLDPNSTHVVSHADAAVPFSVVLYSASDRESAATLLGLSYHSQCVETVQTPGDHVDNDCDGLVDEESCDNRVDDDFDVLVNEDCSGPLQLGSAYEVLFLSNDVFDAQPNENDSLELYVASTGDTDLSLNIWSPSYLNDSTGLPVVNYFNFTVSASEAVKAVVIPTDMRLGDENDFGLSTLSHKGIHVESTNGEDFFLYGINKRSFSADSFLAYPAAAADNGKTVKEYYTISSDPSGNNYDRTLIGFVAHENDTTVFYELKDNVNVTTGDGETHRGPKLVNVTGLQAHDTYQLQSEQDLTGTKLNTTKKISVFSGNSRCKIPSTAKSRDHLVEQMPLVDYLDISYFSISSPRGDNAGDQWKVVATQPNTTVSWSYRFLNRTDVTGLPVNLKHAGNFSLIDPNATVTISIQADKPILVGQLIKSETNASVPTDPSLIYVPPRNQWTNSYWVATPLSGKVLNKTQQPYDNWFLFVTDNATKDNITVRNATGGVEYTGSAFTWHDIPLLRADLVAARVNISHGKHNVASSSGGAFMLIMLGLQDRESYASVAGLLFATPSNTSTCRPIPMVIGDRADNDCDALVDEELYDGLDNDDDGSVDEDCYATPPINQTYYVVYQENLVEYPKLYALELYVAANHPTSDIVCRVSNPQTAYPHYDALVAIPRWQIRRFEFSPAARMIGSGFIWPNSFKVECSGAADVFALNKDTYSADGYFAFSADTLGTEYYVMTYSPEALLAQYAVVATEPGVTTVTITEPGVSAVTVTLSQNEVYQGQGVRLAGTHIVADKIIAAYSGDMRTSVKLSKSRDHLAVQLTSVTKWGSSFNLVPTAGRNVSDLYQIIAAAPASLDLCCPSYEQQLNVSLGEVKQLTIGQACHLRSSTPILVARISQSRDAHSNELAGDPSMILVVPEAQYGESATIATPVSTGGYTTLSADYAHYLTVLAPSGKQNGLLLNGLPPTPAPTWAPINCSSYLYATLRLAGGHKTVRFNHTDPDVRLTAVIDGNADRESYSATVAHKIPAN